MAVQGFQPFSNLAPAFKIGLNPLSSGSNLYRDENLAAYIEEKRALYANKFSDVFMAESNTLEAQNEVLDLVGASVDTPIEDEGLPPLAAAALHVQDDLLLMRHDESGWRLVAGSLCFPSSWNLGEKFGHPLEVIHAPVPYVEGKMGDRIRRIFDALRPDCPLWRENWSLEGDNLLRHDRREREKSGYHKSEIVSGEIHLRTEYQTLHKLPKSGDILFTVMILVKPVTEVATLPAGPQIIQRLYDDYFAMGEDGRVYKGIAQGAEPFLDLLRNLGAVEASTERP